MFVFQRFKDIIKNCYNRTTEHKDNHH
jgi:hypothetical protein